MTKPEPPPAVDEGRSVHILTPNGYVITVNEEDISPKELKTRPDLELAQAYMRLTGLRVTVRLTIQTTVYPPKGDSA